MSFWTVYLVPIHRCPDCSSEIREHERVFLCERGKLCAACGKMEEALLEQHVCDWCGKAVDDRAPLGTGGSVWWCKRHAKVGRESAAGFEPVSKGSLYGEMRRGKLGDAEEARA